MTVSRHGCPARVPVVEEHHLDHLPQYVEAWQQRFGRAVAAWQQRFGRAVAAVADAVRPEGVVGAR